MDNNKRDKELKLFIDNYFKNPYSIEAVVGDAGMRSYYRVSANDKSYIIMDCPPSYVSVQPFINIANFLLDKGFSAPRVIQQDTERGFLILEDFGTISVKNYLEIPSSGVKERKHIYHLIIDLLVSLQEENCPPNLEDFNNDLLLKELERFTKWYVPYAYKRELKLNELDEFIKLWQNVLTKLTLIPSSLVLRDYHVENMMYLEQRDSVQKLGLLDFQDAVRGCPVYDLVSVLEDARFDISREEALELVDYFTTKKGLDKESVLLNYHILGAQRNFRILGVFARKSIRDNNDNYLKYIPRVRQYLEYDLSHEVLGEIRTWLKKLK